MCSISTTEHTHTHTENSEQVVAVGRETFGKYIKLVGKMEITPKGMIKFLES